jgi:tripartite-type tricarboxylate transporter receptor subunit TctC
VYELAPPESKPTVDLMRIMLAYTDFDRPYAAPPGVPKERTEILRRGFERMLKDSEFSAEAKRLLDWDGKTYLTGEQMQKKIESTVTQPSEVINRIKEILAES